MEKPHVVLELSQYDSFKENEAKLLVEQNSLKKLRDKYKALNFLAHKLIQDYGNPTIDVKGIYEDILRLEKADTIEIVK